MSDLKIIATNSLNEPYNSNNIFNTPQLVNTNEYINFSYSSTSGLNLLGNEKHIWDFDFGTINKDQPIQESIGKVIMPVLFKRDGSRWVNLKILERIPKIIVKVSSYNETLTNPSPFKTIYNNALNHLYVLNSINNVIDVFSDSNVKIKTILLAYKPVDILFANNNFYVLLANNTIDILNSSTETISTNIVLTHTNSTQLIYSTQLNNIYCLQGSYIDVIDNTNTIIHTYNFTGNGSSMVIKDNILYLASTQLVKIDLITNVVSYISTSSTPLSVNIGNDIYIRTSNTIDICNGNVVTNIVNVLQNNSCLNIEINNIQQELYISTVSGIQIVDLLTLNTNTKNYLNISGIKYDEILQSLFVSYNDIAFKTVIIDISDLSEHATILNSGIIKDFNILNNGKIISTIASTNNVSFLTCFPNNTNTFIDGKLLYEDTNTFYVYSFPTAINGMEYGVENQIISYSTNDVATAQSYVWYVNNIIQTSTTNMLNLTFINYVKAIVTVIISNGYSKKELSYTTSLSTGSSVLGDVYEGNIVDKLMFFNKEGDNLNFQKSYDDYGNLYWSGDMIFHENSSDTFKTIGLYTLEHVEPISYKSEDIYTRKMQLFNQTGFDIEKGYNKGQQYLIESIEVVNTLDGFYSKWINSPNIQNHFTIGSELLLSNFYNVDLDNNGLYINSDINQDFNSYSTSGGVDLFTVVGNRRDGIMVITKTLNKIFSNKYLYGSFRDSNNVITTVPQGIVQLYDYFKIYDKDKIDIEWNEPFYDVLFYDKKKLSFVDTQNNDGIYTLNYFNNESINQKYLKSDTIKISDLSDIINGFKVKLSLKTNKIYLGNNTVDFLPKSQNAFLSTKDILVWDSLLTKDYTPTLLTNNVKFSFQNSAISVNNFNKTYTCVKVDMAKNIIEYNSNDIDGQILKFLDFTSISNLKITIIINNITNYILTEGIEWKKGNSLTDACVSLASYINTNIKGVSVYADNNTINFHIQQNNVCVIVPNNKFYTITNGVLNMNNPTIGIVGDIWTLLDSSDYDGYIHYRTISGNYYIMYHVNDNPTWYVLNMNKKIVWVETLDKTDVSNTNIDYMLNGISNQYLDDTVIYLTQQGDTDINTTPNMLVERFIKNNQSILIYYGLDIYTNSTELNIIRNYTSDYIDIDYLVNSTSGFINSTSSYINIHSVDIYNVVESFISTERNRTYGIYNRPISENINRKTIIKEIDSNGFNIIINGISYPSPFEIVSIRDLTDIEQNILDVEKTLLNWGNTMINGQYYYEILELEGILVWLEKSDESIVDNVLHYDTIVLESKYPNVSIDFSIPNSFDTQKIIHSEININYITSILSLTINRHVYSINYTGSIVDTIEQFVDLWKDTLISQDIIIESKPNNIIRFSTVKNDTSLVYSVWVGKNNVLGNNFYTITNFKKGNKGIIVSGNELKNSNVDLEGVGFATAMITNFKGSKFPLNNQQYNIVYVDPNTLGLSYQGPFWNNTDIIGYNKIRSGFDFSLYNDEILENNPLSGFYSSQGIVNINLPMNGYYTEYDGFNENVWISTYGSLLNDKILIIDTYDNSTKGLINCGYQPFFMRLNTTNEMMYVSMTGNNSIYVYDIHNFSLQAQIPVGVSPKHLLINYTNNYLYVCNEISDEVIVVDCATNIPLTTIPVGNKPIKSAIDYVNKLLYVICETDNMVYVIDTDLNILKNLFSLGVQPSDIKFDTIYNRVWISNYSSNTINQITYNHVVDNFTNTIINVGSNPIAIEYFKTDKQMYVLCNNLIQIYNLDNTLKYSVELPINGNIMKYVPITRSLIITSTSNNKIMIVNIDENYTVQTLNVGSSPTYLSYSNNGKTYVINYLSTYISDVFKIDQNSGSSGTNALVGILSLTSRDFLRYPRERFDGDEPIYFKFSWEDDTDESIFLYDFSGIQLYNTMYNYFTDKTERIIDYKTLNYSGSVPLIDSNGNAKLNRNYNYDLTDIKNPAKQQTVFDETYFPLDVINSETNIDTTPFPIQTFIGYNSPNEGVNTRTLKIERIENIYLSITTKKLDPNNTNSSWLDIVYFSSSDNSITIKNSNINLIEAGFLKGQIIQITGKDYLNTKNQSTFKNSGFIGQIVAVYVNKIIFTSYNMNIIDEISLNTTTSILPPFKTKVSAFDMLLTVMPTTIAKINITGQTEIEDERFNVMLNNFGYNINHRDIYIFKEYDINENGIDWIFLNQKRKEMLINYSEIYNYLGSYKALINAVNYFGYNDLEVYEYYLNVDTNSPFYKKYYKVEIPDIFDTSVEGYHPSDFISKNLPDKRFKKTRLFNLTYRITDIDGNFVLGYSLDEVITKLLGLKKWLRNHIMPLGTRIKDLTGRADLNLSTKIKHDFKQNRIIKINESLTPINFNIVAYQQPVENYSRTYNVHLEFFSENNIISDYFQVNITTFSDSTMMRSVQIMKYYKTDMKDINFAADKNIDSFILVEVITENGYGSNFKIKKTYTLDKSKFL